MSALTSTAYGRAAIMGIIIIIFYAPYCMAHAIATMAYGKKIPSNEYWKCWIPFYNIIHADHQYNGKYNLPTYGIVSLVVIPIRILVFLIARESQILYIISIVLFMLGIVFWYISQFYFSFMVMKDTNMISVVKAAVFSIIFPWGFFYINHYLLKYMEIEAKKSKKVWKGNV